MRISKKILCRHWVHSHEEDTETELVFRPAAYPFPPSRGRLAFELRADATARVTRPGSTDRPVRGCGRWALRGAVLEIEVPEDATRLRVHTIDSASAERLVLRKG